MESERTEVEAATDALHAAVERDHLIQSAIADVLRISLEPLPLDEFMRHVLKVITALGWLPFEPRGCVFLLDETGRYLLMKAELNMPRAVRATCGRVPVGRCVCGRAVAETEIVFRACEEAHHCVVYPARGTHGHYCVPLLSSRRSIGLLKLYVREGVVPGPPEEQFVRAIGDVLSGVAERRTAEEALRRSEERLDVATHGTDAGIWEWDVPAGTMTFSSQWKRMLGYEAGEVGDRPGEWADRLHPDDRAEAEAALRAFVAGDRPAFEAEYRLRHRDGSYRWCLGRGAAVRDAEGRAARMIWSDLDITERKRVERALRHREASLEAARRVVEHLLPRGPLVLPGLEVTGTAIPADYAQGDLFDYFVGLDGRVLATVADVSGHGIGAALLMTSMHARLRSYAQVGLTMGELLARTNLDLAGQTDNEHFISMVLVQLDARARTLAFVNAGHPPGLVFGRDGRLRHELESVGPPLAVLPEAPYPAGGPIALERGDLVALYTDGVFEATSPDGEEFGMARLIATIQDRVGRPNGEIVRGLHEAIRLFTGPLGLHDDVTVLLARVT